MKSIKTFSFIYVLPCSILIMPFEMLHSFLTFILTTVSHILKPIITWNSPSKKKKNKIVVTCSTYLMLGRVFIIEKQKKTNLSYLTIKNLN